jgi:hypothetical protein
MARVIAIDLRAEPTEDGRPGILFQFLTIDALLPGGMDVFEQRMVIDPSESVQQFATRIRDAARAQVPRLNRDLGLGMTISAGDCTIPSYAKA